MAPDRADSWSCLPPSELNPLKFLKQLPLGQLGGGSSSHPSSCIQPALFPSPSSTRGPLRPQPALLGQETTEAPLGLLDVTFPPPNVLLAGRGRCVPCLPSPSHQHTCARAHAHTHTQNTHTHPGTHPQTVWASCSPEHTAPSLPQ